MSTALLLRLVLLLPLAGAVFNGVAPLFLEDLRTRETLLGTIGTAVVALPFVLVLVLFLTVGGDPVVADYFTWMAAGDLDVSFAYRVDELSLIMSLVVTGVGGIIHFYSIGYMHGDPGYWRFFSYLNLFIFAMLNLVLANNLPVLFLGWEGVGLCSYLLIGFWYTDLSNSSAANKAFIVNRVGDFAFLVAMFLVFRELGSLSFGVLLSEGPALPQQTLNWIVLLLFVGATGKSAQIPLFVWLPDAMAGPTPVSALIHAATMVTSGLYLLARVSGLVLAAPVVMAIIAVVGAATAMMAATIAIAQNDIKRVLAYSTVSQLGYMFMAAGVGAFFVSIFHVVTHAFFKACLFLGSGSVIHGMEEVEHELEERGRDTSDFDPQDMRTMGGLGDYMPATRTTYLLATLAISGIPLTAGFFSKDEILFKAFEYGFSGGHTYATAVWVVGVITAVLTAFYMMRSYMLTFEGTPRWPLADQLEPHESPSSMTGPLWALGILSIVGGFIGLPAVIKGGKWNWIHHYLGAEYGGPVAEASVHGHVPVALEWGLILLSSVIALGTVYYAWRVYAARALDYDAALRRRLQGVYQVWEEKYYWDEFYTEVVVDSLIGGLARKGFAQFDDKVVDGAVNGIAEAAQNASGLLRRTQTGVVQNYALALALGAALVMGLMLVGI
ncbi:MAG: NADH-quinone oxidoreductase subunit L [Salinibacter sp.]|uniref:NADH-quinone oxidoreductase subunit L n=1 Tax=Salinibacter sp. TaxID=2065818 RepID=UPI0035D50C9B